MPPKKGSAGAKLARAAGGSAGGSVQATKRPVHAEDVGRFASGGGGDSESDHAEQGRGKVMKVAIVKRGGALAAGDIGVEEGCAGPMVSTTDVADKSAATAQLKAGAVNDMYFNSQSGNSQGSSSYVLQVCRRPPAGLLLVCGDDIAFRERVQSVNRQRTPLQFGDCQLLW
jgi:hypothetical protein